MQCIENLKRTDDGMHQISKVTSDKKDRAYLESVLKSQIQISVLLCFLIVYFGCFFNEIINKIQATASIVSAFKELLSIPGN